MWSDSSLYSYMDDNLLFNTVEITSVYLQWRRVLAEIVLSEWEQCFNASSCNEGNAMELADVTTNVLKLADVTSKLWI